MHAMGQTLKNQTGSVKYKTKHAAQKQKENDQDIKNEWLLVSPRIMVGFIGAVACFVWLFLTLATSALIPFADATSPIIGVVHFCFVGGISLALLLVWAAADFFSNHKVMHFGLAVVCTLVGCAGFGIVSIVQSWGWLCGLTMGFGFGLLYVLYGEFICVFFNSAFRTYIYGIFAVAIFACAGILFVGPDTSYMFAIVFPLVALLAYGASLLFFKLDRQPVVEKKVSDSRQKVVWRSYLATTTAGLAAGYAFGCILSLAEFQEWTYIPIITIPFLFCVALFIDSIKRSRINETVTMRWFLPFSAVIVFPLIFVPDSFKFIFALLLLCGSLFPITLSLSAMCKHIVICKLSPIRAFPFGRLMNFLGIALGMLLAFVGFSAVAINEFGSLVTVFSVIAFMMMVIFSASFVMTEDNYPNESRFIKTATSSQNGEGEMTFAPGTPIRKVGSGFEGESPHKQYVSGGRPGVFRLKCEAVVETYGLSNRQKEVLIMLAKGRNAEYITEKLVISSHTAKAHIYNIYQKTGVHSRQELMNLVEETKISEE